MKIIIATNNPNKIEAIKNAFGRYFTNEELEICSFSVDSMVPSQPYNEDVFKGANNRIEGIRNKVEDWDFLVSCEGGLIEQYGNWFNIQIVKIEHKDGKTGIGLRQGFQIPSKYIEEVKNTSVAKVLDKIFDGKGGLRVLTKGLYNRQKLIEDGTIMALTRIINGEIW